MCDDSKQTSNPCLFSSLNLLFASPVISRRQVRAAPPPARCLQFRSMSRQESIRQPCRRVMELYPEKNTSRKFCSERRIALYARQIAPCPWASSRHPQEAGREKRPDG